MKILIAEDSLPTRKRLAQLIVRWGHEPVEAASGEEAWQIFASDPPPLAILDWVMPAPDGIELCRRLRGTPALRQTYVLILTGNTRPEDIVTGLNAGANDFVTKPFNEPELQARFYVGVRMVELQSDLARRVHDLEDAMTEIKQLRGILPICCYCKSVRDDQNYWQSVELYLREHSDLKLSHGVCPNCMEKIVKRQIDELNSGAPTP